ncbi:NitT/TauT family transport system ATP-binding protein [Breoghania corrubedonensis]|uniref:NitT/TauT family transport system ATP-binding protein n=1 Tax=Breoghania corrubedonensis TaxID=665038 RepID=A0A2T5V6M0_9HYPH|nr:ABC transporter ATP-binding protein [Breoghania corrubedonensis]PTW59397.1 NitT/TauT family transport system ATP-binding protein [Breoghania corrubedonensis]
MSHIQFRDLSVSYRRPKSDERFLAIDRISLDIERGSFVAVVGSSGCGKSTLLLAAAGLVSLASGRVVIDAAPVTGPGGHAAMVFQDASLLPWRSVLGNVRFGLEMRRWKRDDLTERALRHIRMVGLGDFADYHPHQLSGGMRQRVNIARALAVDPEVLLMDEPFGALDAQTREVMGNELLRIWERDRKTALFVTHDIEEAVFLADKVVVMGRDPGRIKDVVQVDLPRPRSPDMLDSETFVTIRRRLRESLAEDMASLRLVTEGV